MTSNNLPDDQIKHGAYTHIEQKSGIKLKNVVSERLRQKRRTEEVKKIPQQNRQHHLHPVANHLPQPNLCYDFYMILPDLPNANPKHWRLGVFSVGYLK